MRTIAHDSGDSETIFHCPFCGSGAVIGRSDGTTECEFCHTHFTVQVQPAHPAMPQTINGQPVPAPGMPGGPHQPSWQEGTPDNYAPPEVQDPAMYEPPDESSTFEAEASKQYFMTDRGFALDADAFQRHLALKFGDDREAVLMQVRSVEANIGRDRLWEPGWSDDSNESLVKQVRRRPGWTIHDENRASLRHGAVEAFVNKDEVNGQYRLDVRHDGRDMGAMNRSGGWYASASSAMNAAERYLDKYRDGWRGEVDAPQEMYYAGDDAPTRWLRRPIG
jgi:hypothetical protein